MRQLLMLLVTIATVVRGAPLLKCAAGEAHVVNGVAQCDDLVTTAFKIDPRSDTHSPQKEIWEQKIQAIPYYKDGSLYDKNSNRELPTCTTNMDCKYLDNKERNGYCYPARNVRTGLVVKDKKFCFNIEKHLDGDFFVHPNEVGLKYCDTQSDCFLQPYTQFLTYNPWVCVKSWTSFVNSKGKEAVGGCMRSMNYCLNGQYASLTLGGNDCQTDESCRGAGVASVDNVNNYTPKCVNTPGWPKMCCQNPITAN